MSDKLSDEQIEAAKTAGFSWHPIWKCLVVRHSNGAWSEVSDKLARFAGLVFAAHRNEGYPGDVDGSEIERFAVECGLLDKREALAPCGGICVCHEFNGPGDVVCYFNAELGKSALDAARDGGGS